MFSKFKNPSYEEEIPPFSGKKKILRKKRGGLDPEGTRRTGNCLKEKTLRRGGVGGAASMEKGGNLARGSPAKCSRTNTPRDLGQGGKKNLSRSFVRKKKEHS